MWFWRFSNFEKNWPTSSSRANWNRSTVLFKRTGTDYQFFTTVLTNCKLQIVNCHMLTHAIFNEHLSALISSKKFISLHPNYDQKSHLLLLSSILSACKAVWSLFLIRKQLHWLYDHLRTLKSCNVSIKSVGDYVFGINFSRLQLC